jgi:hypothetical protein
MNRPRKHARIPDLPVISSLPGARVIDFHSEARSGRSDFVLDYQAFCPSSPPEIGCQDGKLFERVSGVYQPRRVRFRGVTSLCCEGLYANLSEVPLEQPERILTGPVVFYPSGAAHLYCLLWSAGSLPAEITLHARSMVEEEPGDSAAPASYPIEIVRSWSPPPILSAGLIPDSPRSRQRYGGDPVTVHVGGRVFHHRLFVGGVDSQSDQRPAVDAVLNLGEEPSRWLASQGERLSKGERPSDRSIIYGEGQRGMTVAELTAEAGWIIERLHAGQRLLVHCAAGFNRSVSVCCAALILLEGLSAEAALARVRERHAWAHPDACHWLALQWLAKNRPLYEASLS